MARTSPGRLIHTPMIVLAQSAVAVSAGAVTTEETLATITVPAGAMGLNGTLRIWTTWGFTNGADDKILRVRFSGAAGTIYHQTTATTTASTAVVTQISNVNAANSQKSGASSSASNGLGGSAGAVVTSAVDTSVATTIVITGQKETVSDTLTLERYVVELIPGA